MAIVFVKFSIPDVVYLWRTYIYRSASDGSLTINSTVLLNDGTSIPLFGFGVYPLRVGEETENAVRWALQYGYRHVDTASNYGLE